MSTSKGRKSRRKSNHSCKLCGAKKEIVFEGDGIQYPVFSCPKHGKDERNEWEIWWNLYRDRWKEKEYWDKPADKLSCLLGYFCTKFKDFYGYDFTFEYTNPIPYKCKDFTMGRRILAMLNADANEARTYIRWVFAKKVRSTKYTVTSLGFFASAPFVNEYKAAKARSLILKRATKLPANFVEWCDEHYPSVLKNQELETWNDLNGLVTFIKSYGLDNEENCVVSEAIKRGMLPQSGYRTLED
jgi:hypothetical protein